MGDEGHRGEGAGGLMHGEIVWGKRSEEVERGGGGQVGCRSPFQDRGGREGGVLTATSRDT